MELDITTYIVIAIVVLGIALAIFYYIVFNAVKNANKESLDSIKEQENLLILQNRLLIKQMIETGSDPEEIKSLYSMETEQFWSNIKKQTS